MIKFEVLWVCNSQGYSKSILEARTIEAVKQMAESMYGGMPGYRFVGAHPA
jgi:hypothetical protein